MRALRSAVVLAVVVAAIALPSRPAAADVGISASASMPTAVAVGQTGRPGSITFSNTNTSPNIESNNVTQIRLAPSCGTTSTALNLCPQPDPGVFSIDPVAVGRAGTSCAGRTFAVSAPDAAGVVTFTPTGGSLTVPVSNGSPGSNTCAIDFTFNVLKTPTIDADPPTAGPQTRSNFLVTMQGTVTTGAVVTSRPSVLVTVLQANPTLTTTASANLSTRTISDTATVTGVAGFAVPTGTVTFSVYGPNDFLCSTPAFATRTATLAGGTASSGAIPVSQPGAYRFVASYSGDANYSPATAPCNAPNETAVFRPRAVADIDGNGTTDRSVYRDGGWYVHGQPTVFFGLAGDIPVPADYDGNGDSERAVYRNGAWYVEDQPTVYFGLTGDIPVPGDYDGDGDADRAVFRPSTGGWYVEGLAPVFFGVASDIPVPGDYDGNGTTDRAVFRDGAWHVHNQATVFWGVAGDIPVPGDYDGNGTTDRAVFRNGGWYVHNQATVFFGLGGDMPMPGDYDGNGTTDRTVYRNGAWYTQGQNTVYFGLAGDVPLPLPHAIRSRFF